RIIRFEVVPRNNLASMVLLYERTMRCFRSSLVPEKRVCAEAATSRDPPLCLPESAARATFIPALWAYYLNKSPLVGENYSFLRIER
ncbi:MAG: hypothetical protein ABSG01_15805, partial [Anaerolineales bacterium]